MKKFRLTGLSAAAALLLFSGCNEEMFESDGTGTISPAVTYDSTVVGLRSKSSRAEFDEIKVDDLTLTLSKADGSVERTFAYKDFDPSEAFTVGKYTMTASYGDSEEGFEKAAVYGSADFTVTEGKAAKVELTAKPSKAMVALEFDESLTDYLSDLKAQVRTAQNTMDYALDETRHVYTRPGRISVDLAFTKPNGLKGQSEVYAFDAEAQHRYKVTLRLAGTSGEINGLNVTFDDGLTEEVIDIDISDEVLTTPGPEVTLSGVTADQVLSVVEGSSLSSQPTIKVNAKGAVRSAILTTSGAITAKGWPERIDLAAADASALTSLEAMGLKGASTFRNGSKYAVLDFSNVSKSIDATAETASPNMFSLAVTDANGKVAEPVGFGIKVDKLTFSMSAIPGYEYAMGDPTIDVEMAYNGIEPLENVVKVQCLTEAGVFKDAAITSATPQSRAAQVYRVTVSIPANAQNPITLKATAGSISVGEVVIPTVVKPELAINANDVFAKSLWASVTLGPDVNTSDCKIQQSTDGVNFSNATGAFEGADYHVTGGLNPSTKYYFRAVVGHLASKVVEITTEADTQIPNGSLDAATSTNGSASNWENYVFEGWGTNNPMTTSQGSNYAYCRISGTKPTDDSHTGKAAVLRTNGWGSGNSSTGSSSSIVKYIDPGLLHLGASRTSRPAEPLKTDDLECGIAFGSRPSAVKFWTKYTPKNSADTGIAFATVYDAAGNVIANGSLTIGSTDSYTEKTIPLTYARGAAKASKLYVCFMSTNNPSAIVKDGNWITFSKFGNLSRGEHYGSTMYVDDVTLVY